MTQVARHSQQLGMGVADVDAGEAALAVFPDDRIAGEAVLDLTEPADFGAFGLGFLSGLHVGRLPGRWYGEGGFFSVTLPERVPAVVIKSTYRIDTSATNMAPCSNSRSSVW